MKTSALNRISTVALAALAEDVIKASKEGKHIIPEISPLLSALEQEYNTYKEAFAKQTYSGKGKELAKLDEERDDVFSQMRNYLKAFSEAKFVPHHEEAKELYEEKGKLQEISESRKEFNSIMEFYFIGRKKENKDVLRKLTEYTIIS